VLLLGDLRDLFFGVGVFDGRVPISSIYTSTLVPLLVQIEERPWSRVRRGGKPLDGAWLARKLEPFGIKPGRILNGTDRQRGYARDQFEDTWKR